jgi:hypothetical protein
LKRFSKAGGVTLTLTCEQLIHLRDLMGIELGSNGDVLSARLAEQRGDIQVDLDLWDQVCEACNKVDVPVGEAVPGPFIVISLEPSVDVAFPE